MVKISTTPDDCLSTALIFGSLLALIDSEKTLGNKSHWEQELSGLDSDVIREVRGLLPGLLERSSRAVQKNNEKVLNDDSSPSTLIAKFIAKFPSLKPFCDGIGVSKIIEDTLICTNILNFLFNSQV